MYSSDTSHPFVEKFSLFKQHSKWLSYYFSSFPSFSSGSFTKCLHNYVRATENIPALGLNEWKEDYIIQCRINLVELTFLKNSITFGSKYASDVTPYHYHSAQHGASFRGQSQHVLLLHSMSIQFVIERSLTGHYYCS